MSGAAGGVPPCRSSGRAAPADRTAGASSATAASTTSPASSSSSGSSNSRSSPASTRPANSTTAITSTNTPRPPTSNLFRFDAPVVTASTAIAASLFPPNSTSAPTSAERASTKPSLFSFPPTPPLPPVPNVRKRFDLAPVYGNTFFTVFVGAEDTATSFALHEQLARKESGFFEGAFRNEWKESEQRIVRLPDYEPEHFHLFCLWIYNRQIFSAKEDDTGQGETDKEWDRLAKACTDARRLSPSCGFRDAITDAIIQKLSVCWKFGQSMHEVIYPNTDASAPIRKLIVDIATWRWDKPILKAQKHDPAWSEFFFDLSLSQMSDRKVQDLTTPPPWLTNPRVYHENSNKKCKNEGRK